MTGPEGILCAGEKECMVSLLPILTRRKRYPMMKKLFAMLLILSLFIGSVAYASPAWLSDEKIEILSNLQGFTFDYDEMDDRLGVYVSGKAADYQSGDGFFNLMLEGYGSEILLLEIVCASDSKFQETMTGIIVLVDGVRYIFEIPADMQSNEFTYIPVGEAAASMIRAISASTNPVKVRLEFRSGNVDFEMTTLQIESMNTLFTAYEAVGGMDQEVISIMDAMQPVIIR